MKITLKDALNDMTTLDMGCCWFDKCSKNTIIFDNDERGNGRGPSLTLTFFKTHARFTSGDLTHEERDRHFSFNDYTSIEKFSDDICRFTRKYFKSFEYCRKYT